MNKKIARIRATAGFFLEALMLVFIFAYANGNFVVNGAAHDMDHEPLKGVVLSYTMALSAHSVLQPSDIPRNPITAVKVFFSTIDFHGICVALSKALSVSQSERNTFYIASADNIP
jgi:hypothetical protein